MKVNQVCHVLNILPGQQRVVAVVQPSDQIPEGKVKRPSREVAVRQQLTMLRRTKSATCWTDSLGSRSSAVMSMAVCRWVAVGCFLERSVHGVNPMSS